MHELPSALGFRRFNHLSSTLKIILRKASQLHYPFDVNADFVEEELGDVKAKLLRDPAFTGKTFVFKDRFHAGRVLAEKLEKCEVENPLLLAVPSGGVPVGCVVAEKLKAPFDLVICRKLPVPSNPEAGFGAVAPDGTLALNPLLVRELGLTRKEIDRAVSEVLEEVRRRNSIFRQGEPFPDVKGKTVVLVDDGLASGYTMLVATMFLRKGDPGKIIVAIPTGSVDALKLIAPRAELICCLNVRSSLFGFAVADAYQHWHDLDDEEVLKYLRKA